MQHWKTVAVFILAITTIALVWIVIDQRFRANEVALKAVDEDIKQMIVRQNNFSHALDNTYNLLMDHMRGINPKNIPLRKQPEQEQDKIIIPDKNEDYR